ncbi:hypothetical protein ACFZB5_08790 [Streptomyces nodosus]|uniref:hypothetical protein n=1 Tax=Streptomyces nodosus TaxID=40318 RepID=UPI0036E99BD7
MDRPWRASAVRHALGAAARPGRRAARRDAGGITDSRHFVFRTRDAVRVGEPTERNESDRLEWIPLLVVRAMIERGEIVSTATLVGVMALLLDLSQGTG